MVKVPRTARTPVVVRAIVAALVIVCAAGRARADGATDLIDQLRDGEAKIRLSAALGLTKLGDQRGVRPLIDALADSDRNVRAAAAIGLGKLVTEKTPADVRKDAATALSTAASKDSSDIVKKRAKESADRIKAIKTTAEPTASGATVAGGGVYVNVGPMDAKKTGLDDKLRAAMRDTTVKTFGKSASSMATAWPGGKAPKQADLDAKGVTAFYVDGSVVEVKSSGGLVSCKISMLIASYPDKAMFGFLKGGASVQGGTDDARDKIDCVSAVVEDMVLKKIIPTIQTKAGTP